jgi:hypothetical protein
VRQVKNPLLHRYWIQLAESPRERGATPSTWPGRTCGVTAYTEDDALRLVAQRVYGGALPAVVWVTEDVDLSRRGALWNADLNLPDWILTGHLGTGMWGVPIWRGVWFPFAGYEDR